MIQDISYLKFRVDTFSAYFYKCLYKYAKKVFASKYYNHENAPKPNLVCKKSDKLYSN